MTSLQRKLLRDLWRMRGQVFAIGAVVACGIASFVVMLSVHASLVSAAASYYENNRFPDVFAKVAYAPTQLIAELEALDGVQRAEGRIVERVSIDGDVLTSEAVEISLGDAVTLVNWGGDASLTGNVRLIEPAAFMKVSALGVEEQRVNVVIALEGASEASARLGDGYRVEANILIWKADDVVKVPVSALFRDDDGSWAVFVVDGDAAVVRRIELGHRNDLETVVDSGLAPGERVIVHPSDSLEGGALVHSR